MLFEMKTNMTHETKVELCNTTIFGSFEFIFSSPITMALEKLSCVLHDEAFQKALSL